MQTQRAAVLATVDKCDQRCRCVAHTCNVYLIFIIYEYKKLHNLQRLAKTTLITKTFLQCGWKLPIHALLAAFDTPDGSTINSTPQKAYYCAERRHFTY